MENQITIREAVTEKDVELFGSSFIFITDGMFFKIRTGRSWSIFLDRSIGNI